jgi:hypothetical protein
MSDLPTFGVPDDPPDHVASTVVLRVAPDALARHVRPDAEDLGAAGLPEAVVAPFDYLRRNAGLVGLRPALARARFGAPRAHADRFALARTFVDAPLTGTEGFAIAHFDRSVDVSHLRHVEAASTIEFLSRMPPRWPDAAPAHPDPARNLQWGWRAIGLFDAVLPDASDVHVGVIDSGVDTTHPDLSALGIAYDHAGTRKTDIIGHGTHVTGTIAATVNDAIGTSGIARPRVSVWKLYPDRPQNAGRFYVDAELYTYAMGAAAAKGVRVLNLSFSGTRPTPWEPTVLKALRDAGTLVVASMGNAYTKGDPIMYPGSYDSVFAVGSIAEDRVRSEFSSTGDHIDICAPGSNVLSTFPMRRSPPYRSKRAYAPLSGTSMATAHVSGAAALVAAKHPDWTADDIAEHLRATARKLPEMGRKKRTPEHGTGLLDLAAALR